MRKELDDLTVKIRGIVKDFPAVAYRLGFLQNFTQTEKPSLTSDSVANEDLKKEEDDVDNEERKHQEVAVGDESRPADPVAGLGHEEEEGGKKKDFEGFEEPEDVEEDQLDAILKEVCTGDVSLFERCPHFRGWYVHATMELGCTCNLSNSLCSDK